MNIGEKIKVIRTQKHLTQRQLAGDMITRNMLSRIENGAAQPSLQTIIYLAGRLNVSPGFLLAEGEDELLFRKFYLIENIKRAFHDGELRICRDLCRTQGLEEDDEINLILAGCAAGIAKEEFAAGRLRSAGRFFEESADCAARSIYNSGSFKAEAAVYLRYMRKISPTLGGDLTGPAVPEGLSHADPFCVYALALESAEPPSEAIGRMVASPATELYSDHINAICSMREGKYRESVIYLKKILDSRTAPPAPLLYAVFSDLELCSKEIDDYKSAYEYSAIKLNLLERMLSEPDA